MKNLSFFIFSSMLFPPISFGAQTLLTFDKNGKPQLSQPTKDNYKDFPGETNHQRVGDKWVVPNVVGRNHDANPNYTKLDLRDFWIGKIKRVPSNKPVGEILSQSPKAKELVSKPMPVDLTISSGISK